MKNSTVPRSVGLLVRMPESISGFKQFRKNLERAYLYIVIALWTFETVNVVCDTRGLY